MSSGTTDAGDGFFPATGDDFGSGMEEDLRARVKSELEPGERLLWTARSLPPPATTGVGYFVAFAIGLLMCAGSIVVISAPARGKDDAIIGGTLLGLGGCAMSACTIWARIHAGAERTRQAGTVYAVTDRRAIAWMPVSRDGAIRVHSLSRGRIQDVSRVEKLDGSGTLEFTLPGRDEEHPWHREEFKHIPEVRRAEQIIRHNLFAPDRTA